MNFLNNSFTNIPQPIIGKIKLTPNEVSLRYVLTNIQNQKLTITYLVMINTLNVKNPSLPIQYGDVELNSLKSSIMSKFKSNDLKYLEIVNFDTSKVIVRFKHDEWIKDSFNNVNGVPRYSKFELEFKLKNPIPMFIIFNGFMPLFNEFIIPKLTEYVKKNKLGQSYFSRIASSSFKKSFDKMFYNMLNYSYNNQMNIFSLKLKDTYILLFVYGLTKAIDEKPFVNIIDEKKFEETTKKFLLLNKFVKV